MSYQWKTNAYPYHDLASFIEIKEDEDVLRTSLLNILFTRQGERVMLRDFGTRLHEKVFEPNDDVLSTDFISEVREAVGLWDDRIGIKSFDVKQEDHVIKVRVVFFNKKAPLAQQQQYSVVLEIGSEDIVLA